MSAHRPPRLRRARWRPIVLAALAVLASCSRSGYAPRSDAALSDRSGPGHEAAPTDARSDHATSDLTGRANEADPEWGGQIAGDLKWQDLALPASRPQTLAKQAHDNLFFESTRGKLIYSVPAPASDAGIYVVALP